MEETININVGYRPTVNGHATIFTSRLWPAIFRFTKAIMYSPIKANLMDGTCLTIINNLAIVVEGFVTDLIIDELETATALHLFNADRSTWEEKKKVFATLFEKGIEEYREYESIKILFLLRNNISHGRSHSEISTNSKGVFDRSFVESENRNYELVRNFLVDKHFLDSKTVWSNTDVFWKPEIASYFHLQVEQLLYSIISNGDPTKYIGIRSELDTACKS